jgi:phospholipid/cholesterol/gamma-HCH transport system substrate-binding protein
MMSLRNRVTAAALVKLSLFTAASAVVTTVLVLIMGSFALGDTTTYQAKFANASQLQPGDDVRIAGVPVGQVDEVEIAGRNRALVTFSVSQGVPLTTTSRAEIRYLDLVGNRYMALTKGSGGGVGLHDGATIPLSRTSPALDLTVLFDGFKPLFAALSPGEVNTLSMNIVRTLQGEGGTVRSLLQHTASLTNHVANRDELVGDVVTNLNRTLDTVTDRRRRVVELVDQMQRWVSGLSAERRTIGASLHNIRSLTVATAELLKKGRPAIKEDVERLRGVLDVLAQPRNQRLITDMLRRLPEKLTDQARTGTYGSWYQYYLCDFNGSIILPELPGRLDDRLQPQLMDLAFYSDEARCDSVS